MLLSCLYREMYKATNMQTKAIGLGHHSYSHAHDIECHISLPIANVNQLTYFFASGAIVE